MNLQRMWVQENQKKWEISHVSPEKTRWRNRLLAFLTFLLFAAPKTRVVVGGAPLYLIDVVILVAVLIALRLPALKSSQFQPFPFFVGLYFAAVCVSEARAAIVFGTPAASAYMAARFGLAAALSYLIPRLADSHEAMSATLKGLTAGALFTAVITILYSLPTTRPLVTSTIFSVDSLVPEARSLARAAQFYSAEAGIRGRSLLGASTFTSGMLAVAWPLAFLTRRVVGPKRVWPRVATIACIVIPIGILMTYGRTAWLSVIVVSAVLMAFRSTGGRRTVFVVIAGLVLVVHFLGWRSDLFMIERVVDKTRVALDAPTKGKAERERFLSYSEPFHHVVENPLWFVVGSGRSSERLERRGSLGSEMLFDEGERATHSAFSISYYSFGMIAALTNVMIVGFGFVVLARRVAGGDIGKGVAGHFVWQALFAAWCGAFIWWLFGHGIAGEPRGSMVFFLVIGLLHAFRRRRPLPEGFDSRLWHSHQWRRFDHGSVIRRPATSLVLRSGASSTGS